MLEHKGIPYRPVKLGVARHGLTLRARGYPGRTVPALRIDGRRVQTNREIARCLDELRPEPPLFPADPEARSEVEAAEQWADDVLQPTARRLAIAAVTDGGVDALVDRGDSGSLGYILYRSAWLRQRMMRPISRYWNVTEEQHREDLAALPGLLDRIDGWIDSGVLGGAPPNAADFQTAPSVALVLYVRELRPQIERRPVAALAKRLVR